MVNFEIKTMTEELTFTMIKPDAVEKKHMASILSLISNAGFEIIAIKMKKLKLKEAESFYGIHKEQPFFSNLISFITRGPVVLAVLKKDNAVEDFRKLIGNTNPEKAENDTIRKKFATSVGENAIHGSDSLENAKNEISFHFSEKEIF